MPSLPRGSAPHSSTKQPPTVVCPSSTGNQIAARRSARLIGPPARRAGPGRRVRPPRAPPRHPAPPRRRPAPGRRIDREHPSPGNARRARRRLWSTRLRRSSVRAASACSMAAPSASARLSVCGWAYSRNPLMSMTPATRDVTGSLMGTAAQCQRCQPWQKCSAPTMWVGRPVARAVPGPLVPTAGSDHCPPGAKVDLAEALERLRVALGGEHPAAIVEECQDVPLTREGPPLVGHGLRCNGEPVGLLRAPRARRRHRAPGARPPVGPDLRVEAALPGRPDQAPHPAGGGRLAAAPVTHEPAPRPRQRTLGLVADRDDVGWGVPRDHRSLTDRQRWVFQSCRDTGTVANPPSRPGHLSHAD